MFIKSGFEASLENVGWVVDVIGDHITVHSIEQQPMCAGPIQHIFESIGRPLVGFENAGIPADVVVIDIGLNANL